MVRALIAGLIAALALLLTALPAAAQSFHTPPPGSAERRAVLDAVRPHVEGELGAPVEFVVQQLRVGGGWAFVQAVPQRPGGRAIQQPHPDMDGVRTEAVLRRDGRNWIVVGWAVGATDVWYLEYCGSVPRGLLGFGC